MALEEAIAYCEKVAEEKFNEAQESIMCNRFQYADDCRDCAEEHRQLADWLKELKAYKDARVGCEYCKHNFREQHERPCSLCQRNFMDMFEREVNADDT